MKFDKQMKIHRAVGWRAWSSAILMTPGDAHDGRCGAKTRAGTPCRQRPVPGVAVLTGWGAWV